MPQNTVDIDAILAEVSNQVDQILKTQPGTAQGSDLKKADHMGDLARPGSELNADSSQPSNKTKPLSEPRPGAELNADSAGNRAGQKDAHQPGMNQNMKKEESSSSSSSSESANGGEINKDENSSGSHYESQAPEATSPQPAENNQELETIEDQLKDLDDEMLQELSQKVRAEMEARMADHPGAETQDQSGAANPAIAMAEKEYGEKLAKAEEGFKKVEKENTELKKTLNDMWAIVQKLVNRPKVRAATSIMDVGYVDRGEENLKKAELEKMSDQAIKTKLVSVTSDSKKMVSFSKKENDAILDFYATGKRSPELLKVIE